MDHGRGGPHPAPPRTEYGSHGTGWAIWPKRFAALTIRRFAGYYQHDTQCLEKSDNSSPTWSARDLPWPPAAKAPTANSVILSGRDGDDAHHYQEKQVRHAIREVIK